MKSHPENLHQSLRLYMNIHRSNTPNSHGIGGKVCHTPPSNVLSWKMTASGNMSVCKFHTCQLRSCLVTTRLLNYVPGKQQAIHNSPGILLSSSRW